MKKTLMVILALVMALPLVIGSASAVSAASKPVRTAVALIDSVDALGFDVHWMWDNYGAWGYQLLVYDLTDPTGGARHTGTVQWLPKRTTYMATNNYPSPVHCGFDTFGPNPTHDFAIQLTLFKKNGAVLEQVSSSWSPPTYTVTFNNTNQLTGVSIQVYSDSGYSNPVGAVFSTNTSGQATKDLPDGTYYYKAGKPGYALYYSDALTVAGAPLTVSFTLIPSDYTVTFNNTNQLTGVSIQVYSDSGYSNPVGDPFSTNTSGQATKDLQNGTYYYKAGKPGYVLYYSDAFTVAGAPLTVSFTLIPAYTVTFNETNVLSGVNITIWDAGWNLVDVIYTDISGQATIDLQNGNYTYFTAKTGYASVSDDFTVSGSAQTINFTMKVGGTVTFNETNSLSGVYIEIYNDEGYVDDVTTNGTGQATIDLPNDTYYYYATKSGYAAVWDDFAVSGSPQTINFTMNPGYAITFNETNGLGGVDIYVFSDPGRTVFVDFLTTNSSGQGTAFFADGVYYYEAVKNFYIDVLGDFTVSGAPWTESFAMALAIYSVTLNETNDVQGVSIQVYSDSEFTLPVGSPLTTDANGEATIDLLDGFYYYKATKTGFVDLTGYLFVNGEPLYESFTLIPAYTVTFNETNNVAGVSIQVYTNPARTVPAGSAVTTNSSGEATIDLPDAMYYYKATKTSYGNLLGNFTVSGAPWTESFTMIPVYTVTFNETNDVSGVYIYVWDNPDRTGPAIDLVVTNASGQATIELPDGTYYYTAIETGYLHYRGEFAVSGAPWTESFTMIANNRVTFSEVNDLEGVSIDIYSDAGRTDLIAALSTNQTGEATRDFTNGTYYYRASKTSFVDLFDDFTVAGAPLTESFEMVAGGILFEEYFSESDVSSLPSGWTEGGFSGLIWVNNTSAAGGATPELFFNYYSSNGANLTYSIYTPSINATGITSALNLSFKHFNDYYTAVPPPVSPPFFIAVEVSTDGGTTWGSTTFVYGVTGDIGPETAYVDLSAYKGYTINIRWTISGYTYWTDGWYIDDIIVSWG